MVLHHLHHIRLLPVRVEVDLVDGGDDLAGAEHGSDVRTRRLDTPIERARP